MGGQGPIGGGGVGPNLSFFAECSHLHPWVWTLLGHTPVFTGLRLAGHHIMADIKKAISQKGSQDPSDVGGETSSTVLSLYWMTKSRCDLDERETSRGPKKLAWLEKKHFRPTEANFFFFPPCRCINTIKCAIRASGCCTAQYKHSQLSPDCGEPKTNHHGAEPQGSFSERMATKSLQLKPTAVHKCFQRGHEDNQTLNSGFLYQM